MKKTEQNNYDGQRFPMWFNYKINGDHFIVDIAHTEDVQQLQFQTGDPTMGTILVKEILETRDSVKTGKNNFNPDAKFYKVKAVKV